MAVDLDHVVKLSSYFVIVSGTFPAADSSVCSPSICFLGEYLVLVLRLPVGVSKHELSVRFCCAGIAHVDEDNDTLSGFVCQCEHGFQSSLPPCDRVDDYAIEAELDVSLAYGRVCLVHVPQLVIDYAG